MGVRGCKVCCCASTFEMFHNAPKITAITFWAIMLIVSYLCVGGGIWGEKFHKKMLVMSQKITIFVLV